MTTCVTTENPVFTSVPTDYPVSDSYVASRKKGGLPKVTKKKNKRGTKISIDNSKNDIAAILYKKKKNSMVRTCQLNSCKRILMK